MRNFYLAIALFLPSFLLVSFSTDPPNGKTGAPGESFCTECHTQPSSTIDGTIELKGFPSIITPNQTYALTVTNTNTMGEAVRGGFQMTILGPFNTRAGTMSAPSSSSALQIMSGRQYFEHHPAVMYPDSHKVIEWTVLWTAPEIESGSTITYYLAGNIANGNFQNTGDIVRNEMGQGIVLVSATEDPVEIVSSVYPNPGADKIYVTVRDNETPDGMVTFHAVNGQKTGSSAIENGIIEVPDLPSGVYFLEVKTDEDRFFKKWIKR